jgi:hypothetical protein
MSDDMTDIGMDRPSLAQGVGLTEFFIVILHRIALFQIEYDEILTRR